MSKAKIPAEKEQQGLLRYDGKRPDGVTLIPWRQGKALAWDVTVSDTYATSNLQLTAEKSGKAADKAAHLKMQKYSNLEETHLFSPVAIETPGSWNKQGTDVIEELGRRISKITGDPKETSYIFQQISVAIQWGNMMSIHASFPKHREQSFSGESSTYPTLVSTS